MLTLTSTNDSSKEEEHERFEQTQGKLGGQIFLRFLQSVWALILLQKLRLIFFLHTTLIVQIYDLKHRTVLCQALGIQLVPLAKTEQGTLIPVSLPPSGPNTGKRPIRILARKPSELFIHDTKGVLQLMLDSDRLICLNDIDGECSYSAGRELLKNLRLGKSKKSSNLVWYNHFFDESMNDGVGEYPAFIFFPSYTLVDGVTPFSGFRYVPGHTPGSFYLEAPPQSDLREDLCRIVPVQLQRKSVDAGLYLKKIKQSCEAVSVMLGDQYYGCYFKDRWCAINRLPMSRDRHLYELFGVSNFDLGMSDDSLRTFRPFNNIQFKTLQRARFDPECKDISRSVQLFLPHLPWYIAKKISGVFSYTRQCFEKEMKEYMRTRALGRTPKKDPEAEAIRTYYVHFNELEVDLVGTDIVTDIQHGKLETRRSMWHVKFSILNDDKTVRLIGPLPAPLRRADRPTGPTYKIEVCPDPNRVDENKADGILGVTHTIPLEHLTYTSPTPRSLCIINKRKSDNQSAHLAHGSVWCCGIKIDLIINEYGQVDLKCSYVDTAQFNGRFPKDRFSVALLTEVDISHDRLVEVAVGVFEESFFDYSKLSKNCIAYMDMLAMRLTHYRVNRLPGFDLKGRKFEEKVFTEQERDEIQNSIIHYGNVQARMYDFHSKSRLDKLIHQVSRRGVDGHVVLLNAQ